MASLNTLVGSVFTANDVSEGGTIPDTSQLAATGTVTIPASDYLFDDTDIGLADTQTIQSVDLTMANSYRMGTMTVLDTTASGGTYPPFTYDIIGINGDQLLLGGLYQGNDTWGQYVVLSNTDISESNGYVPVDMTFKNTNTYAYSTAAMTPTPATGTAAIIGRVFAATNVSEGGTIPDTSQLASTGVVTIPASDYLFDDTDIGLADTQTVQSVDLTAKTAYRIGTITLLDTTVSGGTYPPNTYDIIGENGDQILLGAEYNGDDTWGQYVVLSNTNISTSEGYVPSNFTFVNKDVYSGDSTNSEIPCFAAGTLIATPAGQAAVETLKAGDTVLTAAGETREIVWAGHRRVDLRRHAAPELVRPVRVNAGAFGAGVPSRDLVVSPDHNLFVDGVLIPAKCLVNGRNVVDLDVAAVTYHHIELATHDVVLANAMPAETYLDTGNRANFAGGALTVVHPDFASAPDLNYFAWVARGCAPLVLVGPELDAARAGLAARADAETAETIAA